MVHGMGNIKGKKKPWKAKMERDILYSKDISEAAVQGGKAIGKVIKPKNKKK